jgi:hypothetical protein
MPELSLRHIEEISLDIRRQEITFSHLLEDLIDHVCCDVEYEMRMGLSFSEAYGRVKQKMGSHRRIKEIQEETLYAVDSKYRKMKNTMKISGIAGTIMFGFATLFKIQHWPVAGIMLLLGAITLAFIFMPSALIVLWKETHNTKRLFLFISGFVTGMLFIFGTLFKIQHWPAAGTILSLSVLFAVFLFIPSLVLNRLADPENKPKKVIYLLGAAGSILYVAGTLFKIQHWPMASLFMILSLIILFILLLPSYTWLTWKNESHVSAVFIFIIIGSLLIILPGALINLSLQNMYDHGYYPHLEQQKSIYKTRINLNKAFLTQYQDSLCYQQMESLHHKTFVALNLVGNIQAKMVEESEGRRGDPVLTTEFAGQIEDGPEIIYTHLSKPFTKVPARDFLMPGCSARQELNSMLAGYMNYVTALTPGKDSGKFKGLLDPAIYLPGSASENNDLTLMSALHSLEILRNNLLTVESCMLKFIAKQ